MTYLEHITSNKSPHTPSKECDQFHQDRSSFERTLVLSQREAEAASPEAMAVCGEEDPGEGLEFLVTVNTSNSKNR